MADLLTAQREIASNITQISRVRLSGAEKALTKQHATNSEAYQLYLKGRFHFVRRTRDNIFRSIELFQQAAFAGLEKSYQNRDWFLQRLQVDPFVVSIRDEPRFAEMVKRIRLP